MADVVRFGAIVAVVALVVTAAVLSNRISARLRIPAPAIFLIVAAAATDLVPGLGGLSTTTVQRIVTIALAVVLFDGGMHLGWRRLRPAAGAVLGLGVAGTLLTAGAVAALAHLLFGLDWRIALLLGTALAPTDPAVVFSVLGRREVAGRSGTILEGESGANDPVGIALMVSLLAAGGASGWAAVGQGVGTFFLQLAIGTGVGLAGGLVLLAAMRRVALPHEGLYPLRVLAGALAIYGLATVARGSGFLAVYVAGIVLGDARAPYKAEIARFHSALASLAEIIAFAVLGLSVSLREVVRTDALLIGLALAALLAVVVRPLFVGPLLLAVRLRMGERAFVAWAGLKGAVPILLGTFVLAAAEPGARRLYDIVFVVVAFSVIVQGGLVPTVAHWCRVPMRERDLEPWALGMRFRHEPRGLHRYTVAAGSAADGTPIADLSVGEDVWISFVSRAGALVSVAGDTVLRPGDEVLVLADPDRAADPGPLFTRVVPRRPLVEGAAEPD